MAWNSLVCESRFGASRDLIMIDSAERCSRVRLSTHEARSTFGENRAVIGLTLELAPGVIRISEWKGPTIRPG